MLRTKLNDMLKHAMKERDQSMVSTIRLVNAAIKERDIEARGKGNPDGINEAEILSLLQSMIKQRNESIKMYSQGGREELAAREQQEIRIIELFLPEQFDEEEMLEKINEEIKTHGAESMKDMGKIMGVLKEKYAGQMDFGKASGMVKSALA